MMIPARKAPRAKDNPNDEVRKAIPRHRNRLVIRKISLTLVLIIKYKIRGMKYLAIMTTATIASMLIENLAKTAAKEKSPVLTSKGEMTIIGTRLISWKRRIPREILPWGDSSWLESE